MPMTPPSLKDIGKRIKEVLREYISEGEFEQMGNLSDEKVASMFGGLDYDEEALKKWLELKAKATQNTFQKTYTDIRAAIEEKAKELKPILGPDVTILECRLEAAIHTFTAMLAAMDSLGGQEDDSSNLPEPTSKPIIIKPGLN